jgi:hypothetical protein
MEYRAHQPAASVMSPPPQRAIRTPGTAAYSGEITSEIKRHNRITE